MLGSNPERGRERTGGGEAFGSRSRLRPGVRKPVLSDAKKSPPALWSANGDGSTGGIDQCSSW